MKRGVRCTKSGCQYSPNMGTARGKGLCKPNLSGTDWRRLLVACPIAYRGNVPAGDFLMCANASQTAFLKGAETPFGYMIGKRRFRYVKKYDLLVREDFFAWAMRNWRTVLWGTNARCVAQEIARYKR